MDPREHSPQSFHYEGGGQDEPLRESEVTAGDRLDDRVSEAEGLADEPREDDRR